MRLCPANGHVGGCLHDPFEIIRLIRVDIGIRRRIAEIDGVRYAIPAGQLDGVKIVPQRPVKFPDSNFSTIVHSFKRLLNGAS